MPISIAKILRNLCILSSLVWFFAKTELARAHDNTGAAIYVDVLSDSIRLDIEVPLSNLRHELNKPAQGIFIDFPNPKVDEYAAKHVKIYSADNKLLSANVISKEIVQREGKDYQIIEVTAPLSDAVSNREFIVDSDFIIHNRNDKHLMVFLRNDFHSGQIAKVRLVAEFSPQNHSVHFQLESGSWFKGLQATFLMGMHHIAEGSDHLLFLFTLLLTAGLLIRKGKIRKWDGIANPLATFKEIFVIVTSFTIGHSLTLFAGALGLNVLPSQLVESLIAFSILVTACHAIIPIFPKREGWIALGFGLIHGLGFATAIQELGVEGKDLLLTIFGFSLGVEFMQALLIVVILPMIYSIYCGRFGHYLRYVGAGFAVVMSCSWLYERLAETELAYLKLIDEFTNQGLYIILGLVVVAFLSKIYTRRIGFTASSRSNSASKM